MQKWQKCCRKGRDQGQRDWSGLDQSKMPRQREQGPGETSWIRELYRAIGRELTNGGASFSANFLLLKTSHLFMYPQIRGGYS